MHAQIVLLDGIDPLDVITPCEVWRHDDFIPCDRRDVERPVSASQHG
jgi:hypothetical protein